MNQKKARNIITVVIAAVFIVSFALYGCNKTYKPADDEIALQITLDTKEDVGLIVYDYSVGENEFSGGVSNADKSLINHNDVIIQPLNKQRDFNNLSDIENLTIKFTIITEYVDPNYDNIYPEEYTKVIETPIALNAHYGESYFITIIGDQTNGYQAFLEE